MKLLLTLAFFVASYFGIKELVESNLGADGLIGGLFSSHPYLWFVVYMVAISHLTITCMSLCFHRQHTHKGVEFNLVVDMLMQLWLWCVTSMSKPDWVSVHVYHHAHSDQEKDPHSPVQKGFWHVALMGVFDYTKAKSLPDVLKIRKTIKLNPLEGFISRNLFFGPYLFSAGLIVLFGAKVGLILMVTNFMVSPLFAVGGVNAIAHTWGYRNHVSGDNSRNIGFLFPLNFIICGELDHNNHHAHQRSCSFRHRWFEFDIGWAYIWAMAKIKLARVRHLYTPMTLRQEMAKKVQALMEKDLRFKQKLDEMAREYQITVQELRARIEAAIQGQRVKLDHRMKDFIAELKRTAMANERLGLVYVTA